MTPKMRACAFVVPFGLQQYAFKPWKKPFRIHYCNFSQCTLHTHTLTHKHTPTHTNMHARTRACLITVFDYAWHVQSGSRDVINLFQQETDAWMSHTNTHNGAHTCCQGDKANVTVSRKQSPKSVAWHSVIIPSRIFTFGA